MMHPPLPMLAVAVSAGLVRCVLLAHCLHMRWEVSGCIDACQVWRCDVDSCMMVSAAVHGSLTSHCARDATFCR